ncbi:MAG: PAS domain S-box protein [candidate division Zixibacteria bacterium]|nr:PAS domain S-box protein [candidate division Zixibacteria bacterium]
MAVKHISEQIPFLFGITSDVSLFSIAVSLPLVLKSRLSKNRRQTHFDGQFTEQLDSKLDEFFWIISLDFKTLYYIDPNFDRICGFPSQRLYENTQYILEFIHPDDRDSVTRQFQNGRGDQDHFEYRIIKPDGQTRWLWSRGFTVRDANDTRTALAGMTIDITPIKEMENRLRRSEKRSQEVFDTIVEGLGSLDENYVIDYCNPAFAHIFEYNSPEKLIGRNFFDFVPEDQLEKTNAQIAKRKRGLSNRYELDIVTESGIHKTLLCSVSPRYNCEGNIAGVIGAILDITEDKRVRKDLQAQTKQLQHIIENSNSLFILHDCQGKIIYFHGCSENKSKDTDFIGKTPRDLFDSETADKLIGQIKQVVSTGKRLQVENRAEIEGQIQWFNEEIYPIRNSHGKITSIGKISRNITERKLAEQKLKYQTRVIEHISEAVISTDIDFNIISWNKGAERIYGFSEKEVIGKNVNEIIYTEFIEKSLEDAEWELFDTGSFKGEVKQSTARKKKLNILCSVTLVYDDDGTPLGTVAVNLNITARKQMEAELMRFKTVAETANYGMAIFDIEGQLIYSNPCFAQIHGYTPEEVTGKPISIFHTDTQMINVMEHLRQVIRGKNANSVEIWHKHKNGREFPTLMNVCSIFDEYEKSCYVTATAIDISQRKQEEQEYRKLSQLHRGILSSLPHGLCILDSNGLISWANREMYNLCGHALKPNHPLIGTWTGDICLNVYSFQRFWKALLKNLNQDGYYTRRVQLKNDSSKEVWCELSCSYYNHHKPDEGIICTATDVSSLVESRRKELENQKQLIQADRLLNVGRLAAGVAHEINNPLTVLYGMVQELNEAPESCNKEMAGWMLTVSRRIKVIVNHLLTFSRQRDETRQLCDINEVIGQILLIVATLLKRERIELNLDLAESLPKINISPNQMQQVFLNIIMNAVDAMPEGGNLYITSESASNQIIIRFKDDGAGMEPHVRDRIFLPFFSTKEVGKGTGLGLSISYGIMIDHGGQINVNSKPAKGTEFILSLPSEKTSTSSLHHKNLN